MKRPGSVIALALTWDGARWPIRSLPAKARAFLGARTAPTAVEAAKRFRGGGIKELRICWVPRLKGGDDVLVEPFHTATRLGFRAARTIPFGDVLGVVYRRA